MARLWLLLQVAWAALCSRSNRRFYDRIAAIYDAVFVDHRVHAETIALTLSDRYAGTVASTSVLDLGCGTGMLYRMLRERGFRVVGLDLSYESLRVLKRGDEGAAVIQADAQAVPLASASLDCVVCLGTWRHFANSRAVLDEIARALTVHGVLVIGYFPPALGGKLRVGDGVGGRFLVRLYRRSTRGLGYVDRADFELEGETLAAAGDRFGTVTVIRSGPNARLILASDPKGVRSSP